MTFHIKLKVTTEHDSDRKYEWMAFVSGTSFRVYATTEESAKRRLAKAVRLGMNALYTAGGAEGVKEYLERHGIQYLAKDDSLMTFRPRDRELEHDEELVHGR